MLRIIYTSRDETVAKRIESDFVQAGYTINDGAPTRGDVVILVVSPEALADQSLMDRLDAVLDLSLHIVPVATETIMLPDLIGNLPVVDLSDGYDFEIIRGQVDAETSPEAGLTMRALTPRVRRANRGAGIVLGVVALIMFLAGLYLVGVLGVQAPIEEYNNIDTMVALTRDVIAAPELAIYAQLLPNSTAEATNYVSTLRAIPSPYRPLVAQTATAVAEQGAESTPEAEAGD